MRKTIEVGKQENTRSIAILDRNGAEPAIFWLGGFKSDMISTKATFLDEYAHNTGQACVRFDYSGHGISGGSFEQGTISRWLEEATAVIQASAYQNYILVGSSMGGWIALLLALNAKSQTNKSIKGIVLIAPAVDMTQDLIWPELNEEQKHEVLEKGRIEIPSQYGPEPYVFTKALIEDGLKHSLFSKPLHLKCPIHILQGQQDPDVPFQHALKLVEHLPNDDVTLTLIPDGDHRLSRVQDLDVLKKALDNLSAS